MNHTKEPWQHHLSQLFVTDEKGQFILGECNTNYPDLSAANARRIVACVNACEGIRTETLEGLCRPEFKITELSVCEAVIADRMALTAHRDALLTALRGFVKHGTCFDDEDFERALAAIAMVEGGAE